YTKTARELGYLEYPEGSIVHPNEITKLKDQQSCIITTGSQAEPTTALSRMALGDHRHVAVKDGDTVVMSATPIPGNEELVSRTIDNLFKLGAEVIYDPATRPHVSGHASQEELKLLLNILRPEHFLPIHGEYRMLVRHARLAMDVGVAPDKCCVPTNGDLPEIIELTKQRVLEGLAEAQTGEHLAEAAALKETIHSTVATFLYERTKRRPMVMPVIMQV